MSLLLLFGSRRFNPLWPSLNLPALQAWYTADDPAYLRQNSDGTGAVTADGDPVGYCMDRSGNARHVIQATTANKPTWKVNIRNGRAVLRYDGGDWLANAAPGALLRNVAGVTMVLVYQSTGGSRLLAVARAGDTEPRSFISRSVTSEALGGGRRLDTDTYAAATSAAGVVSDGVWGVQALRTDHQARNCTIYYQSAQVAQNLAFSTAGNTSDTDSFGFGLGARMDGNGPMTGDEAEVIICGADIGLPLLTRLWNEYLRPKWGVPA